MRMRDDYFFTAAATSVLSVVPKEVPVVHGNALASSSRSVAAVSSPPFSLIVGKSRH